MPPALAPQFAGILARMGSDVHFVYRDDLPLPKFDHEVTATVALWWRRGQRMGWRHTRKGTLCCVSRVRRAQPRAMLGPAPIMPFAPMPVNWCHK